MIVFIALVLHGAWGAWDEIIPIVLAVIFTGLVVFALWYSRHLKADVESSETETDQNEDHPYKLSSPR